LLFKNIQTKVYRIIVLPVVFRDVKLDTSHFGRKSLENRVLKAIFWPKKNEVTGELRGLNNEAFYSLHTLPNIFQVIKSRRMRRAGHVAGLGLVTGEYRLLGRLYGKRLLGRPRREWKDNIETDLPKRRVRAYVLILLRKGTRGELL
jgi:hypothetical protein